MTRSRVSIDSDEAQKLIHYQENGLKILLFVKKSDGEETNHIAATATEDPAADYASRARSAYAKLKAIG